MSSWAHLPPSLQALRRGVQQFRAGGKVPICMLDVDMAQVGAESRQKCFDVLATPIPATQRLDRKSMPKVVQTWSVMVAWLAQSDLPRERIEGNAHSRTPQSSAAR